MKQCPQCHQTYADDTLNFCLSDGSSLFSLGDSLFEETVVRPSPFTQPAKPSQQKGVSPAFAYGLFGLIAIVLGGGLVYWMKSDSGNLSANTSDNSKAISPAKNSSPDLNSNLKAEQDALERERQRLADERKKTDARKAETSFAANTVPPTTGGSWFVVLGSYPKSQQERVNQRLRYVQGLGYSATIVDTDNYSGLRDGYYSVVLGPFSKADARRMLSEVKPSIRDAYAKSGG